MRTGANVSIYLNDRLREQIDAHIEKLKQAGYGEPSRSAVITLALRRYLEGERDNGRQV